MAAFYEHVLGRGMRAADALCEAKRALRRSKARRDPAGPTAGAGTLVEEPASPLAEESGHPFFWAPFVYIGSNR
jgi:CHAT domain-containing protein